MFKKYRFLLIVVGLVFLGCATDIWQTTSLHDSVIINAIIRGTDESNAGSINYLHVYGQLTAWSNKKKLKSMNIDCIVATIKEYKSTSTGINCVGQPWKIVSAKDGVIDFKVVWLFRQPIARPNTIKFIKSDFGLLVDTEKGSCFEFENN